MPLLKKVLFSLPRESLATRWASSFIKRNVVWKHLLIDRQYLSGILSRRSLFKFRVPYSDVIIATGHGSPDEVYGHGDIVLKEGEYSEEEVKGKKIYLLSCLTMLSLGPDLVEHGAKVLFGYDADFVALISLQNFFMPFKDRIAALFFMPPCSGMEMLIKGEEDYEKILKRQHDEFIKAADKIAGEDPEASLLLKHNADSFVYLEAAKLNKKRRF